MTLHSKRRRSYAEPDIIPSNTLEVVSRTGRVRRKSAKLIEMESIRDELNDNDKDAGMEQFDINSSIYQDNAFFSSLNPANNFFPSMNAEGGVLSHNAFQYIQSPMPSNVTPKVLIPIGSSTSYNSTPITYSSLTPNTRIIPIGKKFDNNTIPPLVSNFVHVRDNASMQVNNNVCLKTGNLLKANLVPTNLIFDQPMKKDVEKGRSNTKSGGGSKGMSIADEMDMKAKKAVELAKLKLRSKQLISQMNMPEEKVNASASSPKQEPDAAEKKGDALEAGKKAKTKVTFQESNYEFVPNAKTKKVTAYTLWIANARKNLQAGLDFCQASVRLAELWGNISHKEKQLWKKRAKKVSSSLKSNFEDEPTAEKRVVVAPKSVVPKIPKKRSSTFVLVDKQSHKFRVTGTELIDAAAHLKLLGECLTHLGERLMEYEGPVAVQGSVSVLLDAFICSIPPLLCLTNRVPHLNVIDRNDLTNMLDDIAYIMPGL